MDGISVFVVVMLPESAEKIIHGMVAKGWSVRQIPKPYENENNDLILTHEDSFSSIVQFQLDNDDSDEQIDLAYENIREILARNASELTIDDRAVETDQDGNFKEPLILLSGYNIITIKADDKFGKHLEKKYRVVLEESSPPATKPVPEEQDADVSADTLGAENVEPTKNANTDGEEQTNENTQIETEID
jgi:hypothetical protein